MTAPIRKGNPQQPGGGEQLPHGAAAEMNRMKRSEGEGESQGVKPGGGQGSGLAAGMKDPGAPGPGQGGPGGAAAGGGPRDREDPYSGVLVESARPEDFEPGYTPIPDSDEDLLTQPTSRPEEPPLVGLGKRPPIPPHVLRALPYLQRLAADPDASPRLKFLVQYLLREARR